VGLTARLRQADRSARTAAGSPAAPQTPASCVRAHACAHAPFPLRPRRHVCVHAPFPLRPSRRAEQTCTASPFATYHSHRRRDAVQRATPSGATMRALSYLGSHRVSRRGMVLYYCCPVPAQSTAAAALSALRRKVSGGVQRPLAHRARRDPLRRATGGRGLHDKPSGPAPSGHATPVRLVVAR
jgi:hypothetical protein